MADRANAEGSVAVSQSDIASACGVSVRVVNEYIARFKKAGVLEVTGRGARSGSGVYKINLDTN
jgi:DNA-binding transcriptional regulator LsrR (DeoR family)